jgi:hypothetical protein
MMEGFYDQVVRVVITPDGWTTIVKLGDEEIKEVHEITSTGSKCIEGDFEQDDRLSDSLYDALDTFTFHDIMNALKELETAQTGRGEINEMSID